MQPRLEQDRTDHDDDDLRAGEERIADADMRQCRAQSQEAYEEIPEPVHVEARPDHLHQWTGGTDQQPIETPVTYHPADPRPIAEDRLENRMRGPADADDEHHLGHAPAADPAEMRHDDRDKDKRRDLEQDAEHDPDREIPSVLHPRTEVDGQHHAHEVDISPGAIDRAHPPCTTTRSRAARHSSPSARARTTSHTTCVAIANSARSTGMRPT